MKQNAKSQTHSRFKQHKVNKTNERAKMTYNAKLANSVMKKSPRLAYESASIVMQHGTIKLLVK